MKKTNIRLALFFLPFIMIAGCTAKRVYTANHANNFVKGADVGWLPQMEATGFKFYDTNGKEEDCLKILKERGINTIRLRAWVIHLMIKQAGIAVPKRL